MRSWGKRAVAVIAAVLVGVAAIIVPIGEAAAPAAAATPSDFRPGNIISDANFYDSTSMTASQIQGFLSARGSRCSGSLCLKNLTVETTTRAADAMCSEYQGVAGEIASQMIAKVSAACGISPKVLLATLEKESSLVGTTTPSTSRYRTAMGYACPDTAACDAQYFGFFNQMYSAARQLKRYGNPPGTSNYYNWYPVGRATAVRFHPNAACGSSSVIIENKATAALYYYTPYQPNGAALSNLYGTGDGCSAYGNRNFWRIYSDWFGSPTGDPYSNVDSITTQWRGINVIGWLRAPNSDASEYIWVNVDGVGQAYPASTALSWFPSAFPGYGPNHGFNATIPATAGAHEVCIYRASSGAVMKCSIVTVPRGFGSFDTATPAPAGIRLTGWSVDSDRDDVSYIWVNVDGVGGPYATNTTLAWLPSLYPGASPRQGFDVTVAAPPGTHEVCVYGAVSLLSCKQVTVPYGSGAFDTLTAGPGSVRATGWYVDYQSPGRSFIWVDVDGQGQPYQTNADLAWLPSYLPGYSASNGFDLTLKLRKGNRRVCIYGANSGALLSCRNVAVPYSAAGNLDAVVGGVGTLQVNGWSADLTTSDPGYVWVNVDGTGGAYLADRQLDWFEAAYPGGGTRHGFSVTIAKPPGTYQVCAFGTESISIGCQSVTVR